MQAKRHQLPIFRLKGEVDSRPCSAANQTPSMVGLDEPCVSDGEE